MKNEQHHPGNHNCAAAREEPAASSSDGGCPLFEITVKGHLSSAWADWLDGLEVRLLENGEMVLSGAIVDQAALMGILNKLSRLNLALLSLCQVRRAARDESTIGEESGERTNVATG